MMLNNNRPLKVVHISNPMKFQVAAAEFRALVQGLTSRDAVVEWPIDHESEVVGPAATNDDSTDGGNNSTDDQSNEVNCNQQDDHQEDEVVNNFSACFGPSDHHLMSFDYFGNHFNVVDDVELYGCYGGSDLRAFMGDDGQ
uniref:VQ domain-containing protein n=1 Tax=Chenopodium quinoa TaxID=63459 RepID=A0A803MJ71_CHEQI